MYGFSVKHGVFLLGPELVFSVLIHGNTPNSALNALKTSKCLLYSIKSFKVL